MERKKIQVLIVEDDPDFCFLIQETLREAGMKVVGTAETAGLALKLAREKNPDVVLMDLCLTDTRMDGIEAGKAIRLQTDAKVIILTSYEDPGVVREACCRSFASGYVFKSQYALLEETVRNTAEGHTPQEYLIASLILELMLGRDLKLQSSPKTISNQKSHLLKKLGLTSRDEVCHLFQGLI